MALRRGAPIRIRMPMIGVAWRACAPLAALSLAAVALLAACKADTGNPFAGFDTRCAKLPAARFEVTAVPMQVRQDDSLDVAALTARSKTDPARHRTFGLTTVSFGHNTASELRMIEDRGGARACGTPTVRAELSMQPAVVYLARELVGHDCERDATREHEMRHVAVYRELLAESARRLAAELPATLGSGVRSAPSTAELKRRFDADLSSYMSRFMNEQQADMAARQAEIDTPEEYARVAHACAS